ncbi:MAG: hypothetical protein JWN84_4543 [Nocardioides sp.]|jgi:hypothetical protein|nr:hypothetical protein [Nocardioides sp.]
MDRTNERDPCAGYLTYLERRRPSAAMWRCLCGVVFVDPLVAAQHFRQEVDAR